MAEKDLGIQLEEWEGSEEKQDSPAIAAMEDSLLFESKKMIYSDNKKQSGNVCMYVSNMSIQDFTAMALFATL